MDRIKPTDRLVANINSARFKPFVTDGAEIPDKASCNFYEHFRKDRLSHLSHGARIGEPPHQHTCHEQFLVLEGEVIDHDGYVYKPGDFVLLERGTVHNSRTETGATLAVFVRKMERNI